jgi:hypothetical protein
MRGWDALIPPTHRNIVQMFMQGGTPIGNLSLQMSTGNILGLTVFGEIRRVTNAVLETSVWVKKMPKYQYYIDINAMISLCTPIPHKGDPGGVKRGLSMSAVVALNTALTEGDIALEYGDLEAFDTAYLINSRRSNLAKAEKSFDT